MNPKLIPPFRFAYVEKDVFRGAYPVELNFDFMRTLHLKTMISCFPTPITDELKQFCADEKITNYYFPVPRFVTQIVISPSTIAEILNIICDQNNLPVYIHCVNGGHTTGLIIMCLRKLQMWSQRAMFNEFSQFINTFESSEEQFVSNFNATFELSANRPSWLQHLFKKTKHPTLRVVFTDQTDSDEDEYDNTANEEKDGEMLKDTSDDDDE